MNTKETEKVRALNWMLNTCRDCLLFPLQAYKREMRESELAHWSYVEQRLFNIAHENGVGYASWSIVRFAKNKYLLNPLSIWLWVDANRHTIRRIPELRGVLKAADIFEKGREKREKINRQDYKSDEAYEYFLENVSWEAWKQAELALEPPPASNTGGK